MRRTRRKYMTVLLSICLLVTILPANLLAADVNDTSSVNVKRIILDDNNSAAITEDRSLWTWGFNAQGQLGDGTEEEKHFPVKILENVKNVDFGHTFCGAVKEDGTLWMWGTDFHGELGNPGIGMIDSRTPTKVLEDVKTIDFGDSYCGAIKEDGTLWMWGYNEHGQLGDGTTEERHSPIKVLENVEAVNIQDEYCGAIKKDGSLWMWGYNEHGQLGDGTTEEKHSPIKVLENVKTIDFGIDYCGAVKEDGTLWMWGNNSSGQLGDGTTEEKHSPIKILKDVKEIDVGTWYSAGAIKKDGSLWVWGNIFSTTSEPVNILENVKELSVESSYGGSITENGTLWMWGSSVFGELGNGTTKNYTRAPIKVLEDVKELSIHYLQSGAITEDGSLWMWGNNSFGRLGDGSTENRSTPICIMGPAKGSSGNTDPSEDDTSHKLQCSSSVSVEVNRSKTLSVIAFEDTLDKLKALTDNVVWKSANTDIATVENAGFILPTNATEYSSENSNYQTWQATGMLSIHGISEGSTTITGTASDGSKVTCKVTVTEPEASAGNGSGGGGSLVLGTDASGSGDSKVAEFFPNDWSLKSCIFPVEISRSIEENGSYKIKGTVGIGRSDILDDETKWNKYKQNVEDANKYTGRMDCLNSYKKTWGVKSLTAVSTDKFKALPQLSVMGYFENTYDKNGNLISQTGKLAADAEWKGSINWQFATPIGPLYLNLEGSGKLSGEIGPEYDYAQKTLKIVDGSLKLTPAVTLEGGYGIDKVATIGAQGSLKVPITIIPASKGEFEAQASLHVKLVFVIDYTHALATYKTTLWDTTNKKKSLNSNSIMPFSNSQLSGSGGQFSLMDTSFDEKASAWNPGSEQQPLQLYAEEESGPLTMTTLQSGVLPSSLPIQAKIDEKTVMVFQAYDHTRTTLNSAVLKYSVLDNGIWSEPKAVLDNGFMDMYADMKVVNNQLVLVWQKEKKEIEGDVENNNEEVMNDIAENSEIYFSVFDENTNTFVNPISVTNDSVCNMMPQICNNSSDIIISWVQNDAASLMQQSGKNEIHTAKWNGTSFEEETVLTQAPGTIDDYIVYQDENGIQSVFTGQSNGLTAVFDTNGNVFPEFSDLMTESETGTISGLNYVDHKISCISGGELYIYDTLNKVLNSYMAGESAFGSEVQYCSNGAKSGYIWSIYDEQTGKGSILASMKTENGYSEPVTLAEEENTIWRYFSPILDSDGTWKIITNAQNVNENLNSLIYLAKEQQTKLELAGVSFDEGDIVDGLTGVDYFVTNTEDTPINNIEFDVKLADGTLIHNTVPVTLQTGESTAGTAYIDLTKIDSAQDVTVSVYAENQEDKSNCTVTEQVGKSDVLVEASGSETDEELKITATLKNLSSKNANVTLHLYGDEKKTRKLDKKESISINANDNVEVQFSVKKGDIIYNENDAAYFTLIAEIEDGDYNEDNNTAYVILYREQTSTQKFPFTDVNETDWFYDYVAYVNANHLMTGLNDTTFGPVQPLARAQFAVILHRMNNTPEVTYISKFPDVPDEQWFTDAILWANSINVVTGYTNTGLFGTADNINREQMAVMMYRYANHMGYDTSAKADFSKFNDASSVSGFASEAMQWAVGNEIITGKDNGTRLDPQGNASRAECATIIMRFVEKYK